MAVRIPDFSTLGFNDPAAVTPGASFPQSDPAAAALGTMGQGLQQAGGAALRIADDREDKRQKLNAVNSTIGLFNELVPLHTQMQLENDPAKLGEIKNQIGGLLQKYSQGIDDPATKAEWLGQHTNAVIHAVTDVDKRYASVTRERVGVNLLEQASEAARVAAESGSLDAVAAANMQIGELAKYGDAYGLGPEWAYKVKKGAQSQLFRGAADNLINQGKPDQAIALLDKHAADIDPASAEVLRRRAEAKNVSITGDALGNWALGLGPEPAAPKMPAGGKAPSGDAGDRIAATLRARGWSEAAIEGALNNAITESSLDPNATGAADEKGLFQFHPKSHIRPFTQAYKGDWSPEAQANYVADVVDSTIPGYSRATDSRDATAQFLRGFERPKDQSDRQLADRLANSAASRAILGRSGASPASAGNSNILAVGDSIAAHLIRKAGAGGQESGKVGAYGSGDTAVSGYNPSEVLTVITETPDDAIRGKDVVLSTGTSNDPKNEWKDSIPAQIAMLRSKGAASITVMGVGTKYADRNGELEQIAKENGAAFSGPLRKVGGDGIHSADPKAELAAVREAMTASGKQAPAMPENMVLANQDSQPNRSGLPPLTEVWNRIQASGQSDLAKEHAWRAAVTKYSAMEADARRSEAVAAQQRRQQDETIESEIIADAASPSPKWTAQGIMSDQRLSPEARMRMVGFLAGVSRKTGDKDENTYGSGFFDAFQAIHAPDGDPRKITSPEQLYSRVGPNGDLTVAGLEKLRGEMISKRTPEGEAESALKKRFFDYAKSQLSYAVPELHIPDAKGDELMLKLAARFYPAYAAGMKAGKTPEQLLSPDSKDSLVSIIQGLKRSRTQEVQDALSDSSAAKGSKNPADYRTPEALVKAVQDGILPYEAGVAEAIRRGYIPAPPSVPLR